MNILLCSINTQKGLGKNPSILLCVVGEIYGNCSSSHKLGERFCSEKCFNIRFPNPFVFIGSEFFSFFLYFYKTAFIEIK